MSKSPMVNMDALFDSDVESDEDEYLSSNSSTSSNMKPLNNASTRKLPKPSTNPPLPPETPAAKQSRYKIKGKHKHSNKSNSARHDDIQDQDDREVDNYEEILKELHALRQEKRILDKSFTVATNTIESLSKKLKEEHVRNEALEKKIGRVEQDNVLLNRKLSKARTESSEKVRRLEKELKEMTDKYNSTQGIADKVKTEKNAEVLKLKSVVSKYKKQILDEAKSIETLKKERNNSVIENEHLANELKNLSNSSKRQIAQTESQVNELSFETRNLKAELKRANFDIDTLKQEKSNLELNIKTLTNTNRSHRNSISVQKKEIGDTKTTIENKNNTIRELQKNIEELGHEILTSTNDLEVLVTRNNILSRDLSDVLEKYNKSKSELTLLKRNLESERLLRKRAVQKYKNVSNLRTKEFNNNLNRLNHSASSSNNIKNGTNAGSSSISSELKKVLEATTRELHLKSKSCEELKSKYSSVQSNLSHTINELKKSRNLIRNFSDANKVLKVENQVCLELLYKSHGVLIT